MGEQKDCGGNSRSVYSQLGASNYSEGEREQHDYYATEALATVLLCEVEKFQHNILEPACGEGGIAEPLKEFGYNVECYDLVNRGYGKQADFLQRIERWSGDIITNPPYSCYDSETEVLTNEGWKFFKDLKNEKILSCNIHTQTLEYSNVKKHIASDYIGYLFYFQGPNLNLMVTSNHRMFSYNCHSRVPEIKKDDVYRAMDICSTSCIPKYNYQVKDDIADVQNFVLDGCYISNGRRDIWHEAKVINMDDWLRFFGLWVADGCYRNTKNSQGNPRYTISVKQHLKTFEEVKGIVEKMPFKARYSFNKNDTVNVDINSKQLWLYLSKFGCSEEKHFPDWMLNLNKRQLQILFEAYFFGDGQKSPMGYKHVSAVSKKLIEQLQEIVLKLGRLCPVINKQDYVTSAGERRTLYSFNYKEKESNSNFIHYPKAIPEFYRGKVYCVELEKNGFMVVRRHGVMSISGNSASEFIERALGLVQDGCKVAMFLKIQFLESAKRYELFKKYPPKRVWVSVQRLQCAKNGDFNTYKEGTGTAICYAWFVWEKGFTGEPTIGWINPTDEQKKRWRNRQEVAVKTEEQTELFAEEK